MSTPRRISLGEALITTTLLSIYIGSRGTVLAIAAAQTSPTLCAGAATSLRGRISRRAEQTPDASARRLSGAVAV